MHSYADTHVMYIYILFNYIKAVKGIPAPFFMYEIIYVSSKWIWYFQRIYIYMYAAYYSFKHILFHMLHVRIYLL